MPTLICGGKVSARRRSEFALEGGDEGSRSVKANLARNICDRKTQSEQLEGFNQPLLSSPLPKVQSGLDDKNALKGSAARPGALGNRFETLRTLAIGADGARGPLPPLIRWPLQLQRRDRLPSELIDKHVDQPTMLGF